MHPKDVHVLMAGTWEDVMLRDKMHEKLQHDSIGIFTITLSIDIHSFITPNWNQATCPSPGEWILKCWMFSNGMLLDSKAE